MFPLWNPFGNYQCAIGMHTNSPLRRLLYDFSAGPRARRVPVQPNGRLTLPDSTSILLTFTFRKYLISCFTTPSHYFFYQNPPFRAGCLTSVNLFWFLTFLPKSLRVHSEISCVLPFTVTRLVSFIRNKHNFHRLAFFGPWPFFFSWLSRNPFSLMSARLHPPFQNLSNLVHDPELPSRAIPPPFFFPAS